ncbi:hypothetical protein Mcup_1082 [Metallosphaera cuprina Ar-4]|uniref:Uncharacterized protein n=1 Tax=Metallosphaera cuprina (strain Ar-4) TaxID=1006006 RepID=F4G2Y9_METCR|nr:hypothetical protein Mcup_1082 [Metallosphaera cuprina Ar-4]
MELKADEVKKLRKELASRRILHGVESLYLTFVEKLALLVESFMELKALRLGVTKMTPVDGRILHGVERYTSL